MGIVPSVGIVSRAGHGADYADDLRGGLDDGGRSSPPAAAAHLRGGLDDGGRSFDGIEFRRVLGHYPTGVTVVTAASPDGPAGLTIGSFTSVSMDPPLVSFCLGSGSASWERLRSAAGFCVNVLADDQIGLCLLFASQSGDRFRGVATRTEVTGAPVIEGCLAWIDCRMYAVHPVGDHDIVIGEVVALAVTENEGQAGPRLAAGEGRAGGATAAPKPGPLLFHRGGFGRFEGL